MAAPDEQKDKKKIKEEIKLKMSYFPKGYFPWRPAASSGAAFCNLVILRRCSRLPLISEAALFSLVQDWQEVVALAGGRPLAPLARSGVGPLRF